MSNQLLLIHYILQSKQTDDKIFSKYTNMRPLLRPVTFFSPRSLAEGSRAQNFLTDPRMVVRIIIHVHGTNVQFICSDTIRQPRSLMND